MQVSADVRVVVKERLAFGAVLHGQLAAVLVDCLTGAYALYGTLHLL